MREKRNHDGPAKAGVYEELKQNAGDQTSDSKIDGDEGAGT